MARARRQPPLFEVLHEPSRRGASGGSALSPGTGLRPVQVTPSGRRREDQEAGVEAAIPEVFAPGSGPATGAGPVPGAEPEGVLSPRWQWGGAWSLNQRGILIAIAVVMVLGTLLWVIAVRQGEVNAREKLGLGETAPPVAPGISDPMVTGEEDVARPLSRRPDPGAATPSAAQRGDWGGAGQTASRAMAAWQPGTDPREPAHNYLLIATVPYRDAEVMAQFLTEHGVPSAAGPASEKVDPKRAMANNDLHVVFPLLGVPSSEYSARKAERDALKVRVEQIGKLWRKAGGYEDFSGADWARYK